MGIVSYAQNFEDVILWRALGHIPNGSYVDVGAHHPDIDSVSKAFHDRGWRGVHVEPGPDVAALLREKRSGDTVLQAIVSDETGVRSFYETPGGGLSTADRDVADFHLEHGHAPVTATNVVSITLDDVLDQVPGDEIHWMKIDVEGFERRVLLSWQTSNRRPWIIVIEATYPETNISTHDQWEDIVLSKGYNFVYGDGLNRFYLSDNHLDLRKHLIYPPNVFDEFQINPSGGSVFSQDMKAFMESEVFVREKRIGQLKAELSQAHAELREIAKEHASQTALHEQSKASWKEAIAHADGLVERLVEREADIAEQRHLVALQDLRLARFDEDMAAMKTAFNALLARDALTRTLLARSLADRSRPWPLRVWCRQKDGSALGGLLALPDGDFVDGAYRAILGREPDPHGKAHYLAKLAQGRRRSWLLDNLASSSEARAHTSGSDLDDLVNEDFVDAAYRRALGRAPDPEGKAHYTKRLEANLSRAELMEALRNSSEGRAAGEGLRHEIEDLVRRRRSLLGWRTWLHANPLPPLHVSSGYGAIDIVGHPAETHGNSVPIDHSTAQGMRRLENKVGLLAAAIEGISNRR